MQPNEARWWSQWWGAEDESFVCFTINLHLESDQMETMSNNGCILLKKPRRRLFLNFLKTRLSSNNFSHSHKNPKLHPFPEPKRPQYILLPSSSEPGCICPTPQLDASEGPIIHYQLSNSDEKAFNAAEKNAVEVLLFHILGNSSPLYSSLFSSELPHPPE